MNGDLIVSKKVATTRSEMISAILVSQGSNRVQWERASITRSAALYITGHYDGTIKMWGIDYPVVSSSENGERIVPQLRLIRTLQRHTVPVTALLITRYVFLAGKFFLTRHEDHTGNCIVLISEERFICGVTKT